MGGIRVVGFASFVCSKSLHVAAGVFGLGGVEVPTGRFWAVFTLVYLIGFCVLFLFTFQEAMFCRSGLELGRLCCADPNAFLFVRASRRIESSQSLSVACFPPSCACRSVVLRALGVFWVPSAVLVFGLEACVCVAVWSVWSMSSFVS